MWSSRVNATQALEIVRRGAVLFSGSDWVLIGRFFICTTARDQIWLNPGFQEQLVLYELCDYAPSPSNGIYASWRNKLDRRLAASGLR